ncbi:MAG: LytTR family transcriptional regulator [Azorhizobium sp. 35-67-5]|nr:MAG: LytTR family transcriptional regulator [Azorhizobium sp. 35-67-5]
MMGLPLGFLTPLILTAFLALPLLWFLLRVVPPKPRQMMFPPTGLLLDIPPKEETAARTPWWLTALRMLLAALIILVAAGPIWNPPSDAPAANGPLVLMIDQGWPAAGSWETRMAAAASLVDQAETEGRGIALIPTAEVPRETTLLLPVQARDRLRSLKPVPYLPPRKDALALAGRHLAAEPQAGLVYISDGVDLEGAPDLSADLSALKPSRPPLVISGGGASPLALAAPDNAAGALTVKVLRAHAAGPRTGAVEARDIKGLSLGTVPFALPADAREAEARFDLPVEIRNEIARLEIVGEPSAGAVQLLDKRWRRRAVGVVSGASTDTGQPLLAPTYYLSRALNPFADVRMAESGAASEAISRFIDQRVPVIVLTDVGTIPPATRQRLAKYVEDGGVLVRFAGPRLANAQDDLLPVRLRRGGRVLGGSLSWETPQALGSLTADGPFRDLRLPNDVTVTRQVLAEPDGALGERTWATLTDGTPLVTGARRGKGAIVLFHVTADSSWSNLPLSGTFVEMLRSVIALADTAALAEEAPTSGAPVRAGQASLPPARLLDGFGAFQPAGPLARPLPSDYSGRASAEHPPGFYGPPDGLVAVNALLPADRLAPLDLAPLGGTIEPLRATEPRDLRGPLLIAVMLLLLLDAIAVLFLAGGLSRLGRRRAVATGLLMGAIALGAAVAMPSGAMAQPRKAGDSFALDATTQTRLGYVVTGNAEADEVSRAGLGGLATFLGQRTALQAGEPMGVDIARDELSFFPLLYWPILPSTPMPSPAALARVNAFMKQGGTVIFDTRDALEAAGPNAPLTPAARRLREILSALDVPELEPVPRDHVLTKAFYLLKDFPGRFTGSSTWVEALPAVRDGDDRPARAGDGVSPVIITGNDLAGAWAVTPAGDPMLPLTPGEPRQREMAFRTGVNIAMYVLTGNYKADQVHVPALLERLGQ